MLSTYYSNDGSKKRNTGRYPWIVSVAYTLFVDLHSVTKGTYATTDILKENKGSISIELLVMSEMIQKLFPRNVIYQGIIIM